MDVFSIYNVMPKVEVLEVGAGSVVTTEATLLQPLTPFPLTSASCAARGGIECWVGTSTGLIRYQRDPFTYIGTAHTGITVQSIAPTSNGAILIGNRELIEVDLAGTEIRRINTSLDDFNDIVSFQSGYLAATDLGVRRLDANLASQGLFDAGASAEGAVCGYGELRLTPTA